MAFGVGQVCRIMDIQAQLAILIFYSGLVLILLVAILRIFCDVVEVLFVGVR